jgi:hypothetical protein
MQAFVVRSESNTTTKQQLGTEEIGLEGSLWVSITDTRRVPAD